MLRKEKWLKEQTHWIPSIHTNNAMTSATILACSKSQILTPNDWKWWALKWTWSTCTNNDLQAKCEGGGTCGHLWATKEAIPRLGMAIILHKPAHVICQLVLDNRLVIWGMCPCSNRALGALVNGKDLDNLPELLICSQQYHGFRGSRLEEFSACCS